MSDWGSTNRLPARVALVDGEALTWYGAREPEGLRKVAAVVAALETGSP